MRCPMHRVTMTCMQGVRDIREQYRLPELKELAPELASVPTWQIVLSLTVPWLCLAIYLLAAWLGWWPIALLGVILLSFFTYGSISHDLVHANLGLPRRVNDILLCLTELLAVRSGHAYRAVHLHHHARYPAEDDIEGAASRMTFCRTIIEGLILQPKCWIWAIRNRRGQQGWVWVEGIACFLIVAGSILLLPVTPIPAAYVVLVVAGSWIIPLVTSYIPHAPEAPDPLRQTRLFRGPLLSLIAVEHLYHLEHHLYPQVPHHHWATLARRLDPFFQRADLTPVRVPQHNRRDGVDAS